MPKAIIIQSCHKCPFVAVRVTYSDKTTKTKRIQRICDYTKQILGNTQVIDSKCPLPDA